MEWRGCRCSYQIERCIEEARQWMSDHSMELTENTTEAIILTVSNRKHLQYVSCVSVSGCKFVPSSTIRNLGIMVDCGLTSHKCVPMCKSIYYHFNAIPKMIYCLTTGACQTLDHALVMCNITEALVSKLQIVQNSAARLIAKQRKHQHITSLLVKLQ